MQKAKENSLPKTIITASQNIVTVTTQTRQPSVITIAEMKTMITEAQKEPTTPKLVRTQSGPLQAAIEAIQGPSPLKKKREEEPNKDLEKPQEAPEEEEMELQDIQPVSSSKTLKKGQKSGASATKTQEPQGKSIQEVTLDELDERSETLCVKREAEKTETRITRAQMENWTKDPKIKDQVLIQL